MLEEFLQKILQHTGPLFLITSTGLDTEAHYHAPRRPPFHCLHLTFYTLPQLVLMLTTSQPISIETNAHEFVSTNQKFHLFHPALHRRKVIFRPCDEIIRPAAFCLGVSVTSPRAVLCYFWSQVQRLDRLVDILMYYGLLVSLGSIWVSG